MHHSLILFAVYTSLLALAAALSIDSVWYSFYVVLISCKMSTFNYFWRFTFEVSVRDEAELVSRYAEDGGQEHEDSLKVLMDATQRLARQIDENLERAEDLQAGDIRNGEDTAPFTGIHAVILKLNSISTSFHAQSESGALHHAYTAVAGRYTAGHTASRKEQRGEFHVPLMTQVRRKLEVLLWELKELWELVQANAEINQRPYHQTFGIIMKYAEDWPRFIEHKWLGPEGYIQAMEKGLQAWCLEDQRNAVNNEAERWRGRLHTMNHCYDKEEDEDEEEYEYTDI